MKRMTVVILVLMATARAFSGQVITQDMNKAQIQQFQRPSWGAGAAPANTVEDTAIRQDGRTGEPCTHLAHLAWRVDTGRLIGLTQPQAMVTFGTDPQAATIIAQAYSTPPPQSDVDVVNFTTAIDLNCMELNHAPRQ